MQKPITMGMAALGLLSLTACGQMMSAISGMTTEPASTVSPGDANFVMQAASGGMAEVQLGEMAQERAANQAVRDFGRQMVEEHTRANRELMDIAADKGLTPPAALDPGHQAMSEMLAAQSGPAFDRQYVVGQIQDHETQLALFQGQAELGQDPDLKAFAARYAPVVEEHAQMARRLAGQ